MFSIASFNNAAKQTWDRIARHPIYLDFRVSFILLIISFLLVTIYLRYIPPMSTGLYAIFFDSQNAALARESAYKLLDISYVRYIYRILCYVMAPLFIVVITFYAKKYIHVHKKLALVITIFIGLLLIFVVSLAGHRANPARLVLAIIFSIWLLRGASLNKFYYIPIIIVCVLLFPTIMTVLRESKELTIQNIFLCMQGGILNRTLWVPTESALYHIIHVHNYGFFGIAAVPKLASLYGIESINVPNLIFRLYTPYQLETGYANASFVFTYFSYFGWISLPVNLICLFFMDLVIVLYKFLSKRLLFPCVVVTILTTFAFISADFTTVLISGGFYLTIIISLLVDNMAKIRFRY